MTWNTKTFSYASAHIKKSYFKSYLEFLTYFIFMSYFKRYLEFPYHREQLEYCSFFYKFCFFSFNKGTKLKKKKKFIISFFLKYQGVFHNKIYCNVQVRDVNGVKKLFSFSCTWKIVTCSGVYTALFTMLF